MVVFVYPHTSNEEWFLSLHSLTNFATGGLADCSHSSMGEIECCCCCNLHFWNASCWGKLKETEVRVQHDRFISERTKKHYSMLQAWLTMLLQAPRSFRKSWIQSRGLRNLTLEFWGGRGKAQYGDSLFQKSEFENIQGCFVSFVKKRIKNWLGLLRFRCVPKPSESIVLKPKQC